MGLSCHNAIHCSRFARTMFCACHHVLADTLSLSISFTHLKHMAICRYSRAWIGKRDGSSLKRQFRRQITGLRSGAAVYDLTRQGVVFLPSPRGDADGCYRFWTADVGVFAKGGKFLYWALLGLVDCGRMTWRISALSAKLCELGYKCSFEDRDVAAWHGLSTNYSWCDGSLSPE